MSDFVQSAKGLIQNNERLKTIGWFAAGIAFVFLAISNFCNAWGGFQILAGVSFTAAGVALFWSERVKCAIVIALAGLFGLFFDEIGKVFCLAVVYVSSAIYFWKTKLRIKTLVVAVLLLCMPQILTWIISPLQLILGLFFASRNAQVAALIMKIKGYAAALIMKIKGYASVYLKLCRESDYRVCFVYGYSVFVLGLICFAVLIFWASPGTVHLGVGETQFKTWDSGFIISAIAQLVTCTIGGCFIFSQLSLAKKLREKQIKSDAAPMHLLIARIFCVTLAVFIAVGAVYMLFEDSKNNQNENNWVTYLTLSNIPLLVSFARHSWPKLSITLSSLVAIWHLLGISFVVALVRDNIAKVLSMETPDNKTEIT